jgi:hypothetical protein
MFDLSAKILRQAIADANQVARTKKLLKGTTASAEAEHAKAVDARIRKFMDETAVTRIPPYQRDRVERQLRKCDTLNVRKFSDGKTEGSELDEEMAAIMKDPVNPLFVRKFIDATAARENVAAGVGSNGRQLLDNAIRAMSSTPEGKIRAKKLEERFASKV